MIYAGGLHEVNGRSVGEVPRSKIATEISNANGLQTDDEEVDQQNNARMCCIHLVPSRCTILLLIVLGSLFEIINQ